MERDIKEIKSEIDVLWYEVLKIREKEGKCRNSPQKEKALRLMKELAQRGEKEYFLRKVGEIRKGLAKLLYQEGDYTSALLQFNKGSRLCKEITDEDLMGELRIAERKINEMPVVK